MIRFKTLTLRNFLSYGTVPTVFNLDRPGTTLILGENLDDTAEGSGNNGCGKTAIINGLTYGLYNEPLSKISLDNLVNDQNKKNMMVIVEFEKDGNDYKITRTRKMKAGAAGNDVVFEINGVEQTPDSIDNTDKLILQHLGIPYDLFVRIVTFSATLVPFLDLPASHVSAPNQRDIIEELFDLKTLAAKSTNLKKQISETDLSLDTNLEKIEQLKKEHERHEKQIESAKTRVSTWIQQTSDDIATLQQKLVDTQDIDVEGQRVLLDEYQAIKDAIKDKQIERKQEKTSLDTIQNVLGEKTATKNLQEKRLTSLQNDVKMQESLIKGHNDKIKTHTKDIAKKTENIQHLDDKKCPYCYQKYDSDHQDKRCEEEKQITQLQKQIKTCQDAVHKITTVTIPVIESEQQEVVIEITAIGVQLQELVDQVEVARGKVQIVDKQISILEKKSTKIQQQLIYSSVDQLDKIKNQSVAIEEKIATLQALVNPYDEPLAELLAITLDPIDMTRVNELTTHLEHQKFLQKLLTKKDSFVRKGLLDKHIPFLNERLAHYLIELGLPHTVEFTHEMAAAISQFDREKDFGQLSHGQRARVNIALAWAFRDVRQSLSQAINICMLDEVLDIGLDTIGVQAAARMLKRKAREERLSLFIISHKNEIDSAFDRKMTVQLNKGFSYIQEQE